MCPSGILDPSSPPRGRLPGPPEGCPPRGSEDHPYRQFRAQALGRIVTRVGASDPSPQLTILVMFGRLNADQQALIDLHTLRALGTEPPRIVDADGVVIEFWIRDGDTADTAYDDIRGWAIGHGLPIRDMVEG